MDEKRTEVEAAKTCGKEERRWRDKSRGLGGAVGCRATRRTDKAECAHLASGSCREPGQSGVW